MGEPDPKKKDTEVSQILNSCAEDLASVAKDLLPVTQPISKAVDPEAAMRSRTSLASVASVTAFSTPSEFENSLDDLETEFEEDEEEGDSQRLVFPTAMLSSFNKEVDGGYTLTFIVPEYSAAEVGDLVGAGAQIFSMVLLESEK